MMLAESKARAETQDGPLRQTLKLPLQQAKAVMPTRYPLRGCCQADPYILPSSPTLSYPSSPSDTENSLRCFRPLYHSQIPTEEEHVGSDKGSESCHPLRARQQK